MTPEELDKIDEQNPVSDYSINGGCSNYYCDCHHKVPILVAEVRRLQASLADTHEMIASLRASHQLDGNALTMAKMRESHHESEIARLQAELAAVGDDGGQRS